MTQKNQIWKCEVCGNIIEVLHSGDDALVCCGQPMKLQKENSVDASFEKHVPVIKGNKVFVGSEEHPMSEDHYIEWIQVYFEDGKTMKVFLAPGQKPEAEFDCTKKIEKARAYCNLHGLWKSRQDN